MATHQIHLGVKIFLMIMFVEIFSSCENKELPKKFYFRYSIGTKRIENPIMIKFNDEEMYVCPFTTSSFLKDSLWKERNDVYPFILSDDGLFFDNNEKPIYFTNFLHKRILADMVYTSCYKVADYFFDKNHSYISLSVLDTIKNTKEIQRVEEYQFYYEIDNFDLYMQAKGYWRDLSKDSLAEDVVTDYVYTNDYKVVATPHYSWWQLLRLRITYLVRTISRNDCDAI